MGLHLQWMGPYLDPDTQSELKTTIAKQILNGSSHEICLKVGRTIQGVSTRLKQWQSHCESKKFIILGSWSTNTIEVVESRLSHKLERLVFLELEDLAVNAPYLKEKKIFSSPNWGAEKRETMKCIHLKSSIERLKEWEKQCTPKEITFLCHWWGRRLSPELEQHGLIFPKLRNLGVDIKKPFPSVKGCFVKGKREACVDCNQRHREIFTFRLAKQGTNEDLEELVTLIKTVIEKWLELLQILC
ncbi:hypothetical protein BU17DRAFT_62159 [Hysterangium stoloniferum]|nr:hypothetical protein BU17DRAFT_62159 [Hysterangium stoloniferum]